MEGIRLRLLFNDVDILSDFQKLQGLKQSWLFLKPQQQKTINDLSSYLLHTFQLHGSCPHGILLSMDGFILPPFESTCILKDNDIVSVKKKGGLIAVDGNNGQKAILAAKGNNGPNIVENLQIVDKQPANGGPLLLLANEEPEDESEKEEEAEPKEDTSHHKNALGGNAISKKRKKSETPPSSKKKKSRSDVEELHEQTKKQRDHTSKKSHHKKRNVSDPNNEDLENNKGSTKSSENIDITPNMKKNDVLQKNGVENIDATSDSDGTEEKVVKHLVDMKDGRSRSTKRRAAKKRWRERANSKEQKGPQNRKDFQAEVEKGEPSVQPKGLANDEANGQSKGYRNSKQQKTKEDKKEEVTGQAKGQVHLKEFHGEDENKDTNQEEEKSKSFGKSCQSSETEDEVVPVEIRPGHIRFEPLGKEQVPKQSRVETESFRWNGSMSKKKGQKWGQEKVPFSQKNDSVGSNKEHKWSQEEVPFPPKVDFVDSNIEIPETLIGEKEPHFHQSLDFNTLPFFSGLPEEGLVIAYRLIELSSTWTPEVSSYRVGKVSWYNSENRVLLMPVAEFPVFPNEDEDEDESSEQPDSSLYNEDGSLEIDFSALLEVRLVKNATPDAAGVPSRVIESSAANNSTPVLGSSNKKTETPSSGDVNNGKQTQSTPSENGGGNLWEQFNETLKAKKAELSQENSLEKGSSGKGSWSYRAMRGGALGPTMAFLRSKNEI